MRDYQTFKTLFLSRTQVYNCIGPLYAVVMCKSHGILPAETAEFGTHEQAMGFIRKVASQVQYIGEVVGRSKSPCAVLTHDEREILVMVISIVGKNIEHHTSEHLLTVRLGQAEPSTNSQQLLIAVRIRTQGCKSLCKELFAVSAVKAHGHKMTIAINGIQT